MAGRLYVLIPFTYFTLRPNPLPSGNHQFVLCVCDSVSVLFCLFISFGFLDSTYK